MEATLTETEIQNAQERAQWAAQNEPRIEKAMIVEGRLILNLRGSAPEGAQISVPVGALNLLDGASEAELHDFIVGGNGGTLRWNTLGVGYTAPVLARIVCGLADDSLKQHLANIGRRKSESKRAAARANGAKGGRPRKTLLAT